MRRIGKFVLLFAGIVLAVGVVIFGDLLMRAGSMEEAFRSQKGTFDLEIRLRTEVLDREQREFLNIFALLTGIVQEDLTVLRLSGDFDSESISVAVSSRSSVPITDLRFTEEDILINMKSIYELASENISDKVFPAEYLLPEWGGEEYVSLEEAAGKLQVPLPESLRLQSALNTLTDKMKLPACLGLQLLAEDRDFKSGTLRYHFAPGDEKTEKIKEYVETGGWPEAVTLDAAMQVNGQGVILKVEAESAEEQLLEAVTGSIIFARQAGN